MEVISRPLSMDEIWLWSFRLYRRCFCRILPVFFLFALVSIVYGVMSRALPLATGQHFFHYPLHGVGLVFFILSLLIMLYGTALTMHQSGSFVQGQPMCMRDSYLAMAKRFPVLILVAIIHVLSILLGLVLFVLPGIFISTALTSYLPIVILENASPFSAWKVSVKRAWGNWWKIFFIFLFTLIALEVILLVLFGLFGLLHAALGSGHHLAQYVTELMLPIVNAFIIPYIAILQVVVWRHLMMRQASQMPCKPAG